MAQHEITIEISGPNNAWLLFGPTSERLRGRWSARNVGAGSSQRGIHQIPDIPGMHVTLNVSTNKVTVADPLTFKGNETLLQAINVKLGTMSGINSTFRIEEGSEIDVNDQTVNTFWYHMRIAVKRGNAVCIEGKTLLIGRDNPPKRGKLRVDHWGRGESAEAGRFLLPGEKGPEGVVMPEEMPAS